MPLGASNPETNALLIVAPVAASYSPNVPLASFTTKSLPRDIAIPNGKLSLETSDAFTVAPDVVYSPIVPLPWFTTNKSSPDSARPVGFLNPETKALLIVAPENALYSPIVPLTKFITKIWARAVAGTAQSAAPAVKPERINRIFIGFPSQPKGKQFQRMTRCNPAPERLGLFGRDARVRLTDVKMPDNVSDEPLIASFLQLNAAS
jgi:hypothetical protein